MRYWFLIAILVLGCTAVSFEQTVRIVVSSDLGSQILSDQEIACTGNTIDCLSIIAEVETSYDGRFVNAVNQIDMVDNFAWFYYVNGELMDKGAASYNPKNGDVIQWDFHEYSGNPFEPAFLEPPSLE